MKRLTFFLAVMSVLGFGFSMYLLNSLIDRGVTIKALTELNNLSNDNLELVRLNNEKLVYQNQALRLQSETIETSFPQLNKHVEDLNVKLKRLESLSLNKFSLELPIRVQLNDSVTSDSNLIQTFQYNDGYFSIAGQKEKDSLAMNVHYTDTIKQVVFKGKRYRPWLWIFSKRKLMQRISIGHPNSKLVYSKHIQIEP